MTREEDINPSGSDVESYLDPVTLRRTVRGANKLKGVQPELLQHWNNLDQQFQDAGVTPEIKSGFRTAQQQQSLYNNPATRARTKGNDGISKISPHQRGEALDISFPSAQRAKGHQIIAQYAQANGLQVPTDEPWHIGLTSRTKPDVQQYLDPSPADVENYLDPQTPSLSSAQSGAKGIAQPQERVTSTVKEADTGTELPVSPLAPAAGVQFQPGSGTVPQPLTLNPIENLYRVAENSPEPSGTLQQQFEQRRFKAPESAQPARRVKLNFPSQLNPSPQDVEAAYIKALGPEYEEYNKMHIAQTGKNLVSFHPEQLAQIKRESDGSFYVSPRKDAIDYLNAYVTSGGNLDKANEVAQKNRQEQFSAAKTAQEGAKQDVAEVEKIRKEQGAEGGAERSLTAPAGRVTAETHKLIGGITSLGGVVPNDFSDYMNRRGEIIRQGASLPPLTQTGEEIQRSIPEKVATAVADTGLSIAQLLLTKKATGLPLNSIMAIETGLKNTDKSAPERAKEVAESFAMGSALEAHLDRATATAMFAVPTAVESAQGVARGGMSKEDAILNTLIEGGTGAVLSGSGEGERLTELGIEKAPTVGVPGEATANIDQRLAEREAAVKPVTDAQGNVLLNPDEVVQGGKPKIKLANSPNDEPAHLANFRERASDGTFTEGAAKVPEEFKPENVQLSQPATENLQPPQSASEVQAQPAESPPKAAQPVVAKTETTATRPPVEGEAAKRPAPESVLAQSKNPSGSGQHEIARVVQANPKWKEYVLRELGEGAMPLEADGEFASPADAAFRTANGDIVTIKSAYGQDKPPTLGGKRDGVIVERIAASPSLEPTAKPESVSGAQPLAEAAGPAKEAGAPEPGQPPESTTSARQAQLAADRAKLDLPELPQVERKSWRTSLRNAQDKGLDKQAGRIADGVNEGHLKALDDEQTAGLVLRMQQIKNEHAELQNQIYQADPKSEEFETLRAQNDILESEADKLQRAMNQSGSEKGRTLAAQKLTINQDMDLVSLITRAKAKGLEITPERRAKYEAMDKEINGDPTAPEGSPERLGLRERARLAEEKAKAAELQSITERIARKTKRTQAKKTLDDEAAVIKTNIAAEFARLKTQLGNDNVRSMAGLGNLDPEGVITKNLAKYLRNRVQAGVTDAAQILDDAYNLIKEHVDGITKGDVLDALLAKSRSQRTELATQLTDVRKQLNDLAVDSQQRTAKLQGPKLGDKQGPTQAYFKTRKVALLKQEADLQRRIAERDYSQKAKRPPIVYNKELNDIQARVESLRKQYQHDLDSAKPKTVGDLLVRWKRFAVLTYPQTFGKLTSAATARMVSTPAEEMAGTVLSKVPGLRQAFTGPREGPINLSAETKAVSQLWQSESFKDMLRHVKGGEDILSLLYGKGKDEFYNSSESGSVIPGRGKTGYERFADITDRPGHYHAAIKTIPKRAEFFRSFEKRLEDARKQGKDRNDPVVQMGIAGQAYVDAQRALLQQPNPLSEAFNRAVNGMAHSDYRINRALSRVARFAFPITRVPVNFATETAQNIGGLPAGLGEIAARGVSARVKPLLMDSKSSFLRSLGERMPDALNELEPEQKDRIARMLKKGSIGSAFVLWGMLRPDQFGGYYQPGKRDPEDVKAGGMRFLGVNIPRWMGHIPLLEAAQFGATIRRVYDQMRDPHKDESKTEAAVSGTKAAATGLAKEVPFIEPFVEGVRAFKQPITKTAGEQVKGVIPGAVQAASRKTDSREGLVDALNPFSEDRTVKRGQKGFSDTVLEGTPFRRLLPVSEVFPERSKASDEVQRLGVQLYGARQSKDETMAEFKERQGPLNQAIRESIESVVSSPDYGKLSNKEKAEQIKAARDFAIKMAPRPIRKLKDLAPALMAPPTSSPSPNLPLY